MRLFNNKKHINLLVLILINCQIALSQISGPTNICSGAANLYNCIPTAATYSWSSLPSISVTITNITSQSTNFITNPLTPTTYTLICTTVSPNNTYSLIVNNNTPPAPTGVNTNACEGSPINLNASGGAPTIQWFTAPTGGTSLYSGNTYNPGFLSPGGYTYYIETSSGGCVSNRNSINLTVLPTPFVTINGGNTSICQGSNTNLSVSVSGGVAPYSYNWTPAANLSAPTSSNTIASPTVNTTYSVSVIDANGCSANTNTTQITVNSTPTISTTSGSICLGQTYTTTAIGATTYTWSTGAISPSIAVTPTTTTIYTVTGSVGTCSASVNSTITVQPTPTISATSGSICLGQTFTTTANGASTYAWNTGATTSSIAVTPTTTTVYTVTGSVGTCSASVNSTITVQPTPTITVNSGSICLGQTFTISASGADTYTWNTSQNSSSIVVSPTVTTSYSVIGTNTLGCEGSSSSTINIISSKQILGITTSTTGNVTGEVTLYKYSPILSMWDSVATVNFNPGFNFGQQDSASYVLRAIPSATNIQTTYGNSSINWQNATILNHGCTANSSQTITLIPFENIGSGSGVLIGTVVEGIGFGQKPSNGTSTMAPLAPGNPIGGIIVKGGKNPGGNMFTQTETDASGTFTITGIPNTAPGESIFVFIDIPGLDTSGTYCRTFVNGESYTGLNFVVDSAKIRPVNPNQCLDVRISENSFETSLTIYPNPAKDVININFELNENANVKIELIDVIGRTVETIINNSTLKSNNYHYEIDLKNMNSGIYFLKLGINSHTQTTKIIIQD